MGHIAIPFAMAMAMTILVMIGTPSSWLSVASSVPSNDFQLGSLHSFDIIRPVLVAAAVAGDDVNDATAAATDATTHFNINTAKASGSKSSTRNDDTIRYSVRLLGIDYQLELTPSDNLFHPDYEEIIVGADGGVLERRRGAQVDTKCYYRGRVIGVAHSSVTLSTCSDAPSHRNTFQSQSLPASSSPTHIGRSNVVTLTGVISLPGMSALFIEPADVHAHQLSSFNNGDHIVYRLSDVKNEEIFTCGVGDDHTHPSATDKIKRRQSNLPVQSQPLKMTTQSLSSLPVASTSGFKTQVNGAFQKYVEVLVVNDKRRYDANGDDTHNLSKQIMNQVAVLYSNQYALQFAYRFEIRLIGQITFAYGDPYGTPASQGDPGEISHSDLLTIFSNWQSTSSMIPPHDNAVLLSGYDFAFSTVGFANLGAMCRSDSSTSVIQATSSKPLQTAPIVAHEIGHNFGMRHDDDIPPTSPPLYDTAFRNTWCSNNLNSKIMSSSSSTSEWPTQWSNCSQLYIDNLFDGTPAAYGTTLPTCLENVPTREWTNASVCGDGIRNGNEQCDCGIDDCAVVDPCCNGATCMLVTGATCSNHDPCCDTCAIVTDSRPCRPSMNTDCDVPETCNGVSAFCPTDVYARPGSSCTWNVSGETGSGRCYSGGCLSHDSQCLAQQPYITTANISGQCFTLGDFNGANACADLYCGNSVDPLTQICSNYDLGEGFTTVFDGVPCASGRQCYMKACVDSTSLPYTDIVNARWLLGNYGECSSACGGTQTRSVRCVNTANVTVIAGLCTIPAPSTSQSCIANSSCAFEWTTTQWTGCSATCLGQMTRLVECRNRLTNALLNNTFCVAASKPASLMLCNTAIACGSTGGSNTSSSTGRSSTGTQAASSSEGFFGVGALDAIIAGKFTVGGLIILLIGIAILLICCFWGVKAKTAEAAATAAHHTDNIKNDLGADQPPNETELTTA